MSLVVSLSSIPPRFDKLEPVLNALLAQTAKIDEIRLYLPKTYRRFPDYDGSLPDVPRGVRIVRPDDDLGPSSKVLFAAEDLRGTDCNIIYCDDDRVYHRTWFSRMLAAQGDRMGACVATSILELDRLGFQVRATHTPRLKKTVTSLPRTMGLVKRKLKQLTTGVTDRKPPMNRQIKRSGYGDIAEGCGAVLVRPDFFDTSAFDIPKVLWSVDDVWLSGHMARKGIGIWIEKGFGIAPEAHSSRVCALYDATIDGVGRDAANRACVRYMQDTYGIWR